MSPSLTAMPASSIIEAVQKHRADTAHDLKGVTVEGVWKEYCTRCGKARDRLQLENGSFLPCSGLIGTGL